MKRILAPVLLVCGASGALAGGDDLFGEGQGHPPQVIGIARDVTNFRPIAQVRVTAVFKSQTYVTSTDAEGRFRIEGFNEFDPKLVEISCAKPGYKPVNVIRRQISQDPNTPLEVECLNQPA
jgi:hypothetical protein